jgi:hypothetical protein
VSSEVDTLTENPVPSGVAKAGESAKPATVVLLITLIFAGE